MTGYEYFDWKDGRITGKGVKPAGKEIRKIVVLLHGFMGDAESNTGFAEKICALCPHTAVIVPDGIDPVPPQNDPAHRQWYPLPATADDDGYLYSFMPCYAPAEKRRQMRETTPEIQKTARRLNRIVLNMLEKYDLSLADCFVAGISQGGITAFDMVLFRTELHKDENGKFLAGLIIIGAGINEADRMNAIPRGGIPPIPVLLARGKYDEIFPRTVDYFSAAQLRLKNMPVETTQAESVHFGLEHRVCDAVCRFIRQHS